MEIGLLLVRVVVGALLVGHGAQKLFGSFGGYGVAGTGGWFESIGFRPGRAMAVVAGLSELVGGLLLVLGLLTPLASAAIVGTMVVAASTHAASGLWNTGGGYELPLVLAVVGATVALTGPGAYSLDAVLGLQLSPVVGLGAIALGVLAALVVVARARTAVRSVPAAA
ncbi:DoxX family protein [Georgenia muralis]|uniref:Putative oxidoreductase n=1 Tax=Georgenia muralis TaxID=154117 RepID=A0A3N4Z5L3_9MICO|nr:DoxX family protein [Georgenia muralis]RPF27653.1 putative oxidoreductase [Georgenia muralis]